MPFCEINALSYRCIQRHWNSLQLLKDIRYEPKVSVESLRCFNQFVWKTPSKHSAPFCSDWINVLFKLASETKSILLQYGKAQ